MTDGPDIISGNVVRSPMEVGSVLREEQCPRAAGSWNVTGEESGIISGGTGQAPSAETIPDPRPASHCRPQPTPISGSP